MSIEEICGQIAVKITSEVKDTTWSPSGISSGAPFVFITYIYDLPLNIQNAKLVLIADDINIHITDKNIDIIQERLNRVMKHFETWFSNNSLPSLTLIKQGQRYCTLTKLVI